MYIHAVTVAASGGTLMKKNKSAELSRGARTGGQQWDNRSQVSSILKNGTWL